MRCCVSVRTCTFTHARANKTNETNEAQGEKKNTGLETCSSPAFSLWLASAKA